MEIFTAPWIFVSCSVLFAAFIRGLAGFGFALILAPMLLLILEPVTVVVVNLFLGLLSNIPVLFHSFTKVRLTKILPMMMGSLLGIPLGVWIINILAPNILKILIGVIVIIMAVLLVMGLRKTFTNERLSSIIAGFSSGILATSTSLGGPPVVLFMHSQNWPKDIIHPSLAAYFTFLSCCSLGALSLFIQVNVGMVIQVASLIPAMLLESVWTQRALPPYR